MKAYQKEAEKQRMMNEGKKFTNNIIQIKSHWVEKLMAEDYAGKKIGRGKQTVFIPMKPRKEAKRKKIKLTMPSDPDLLADHIKRQGQSNSKDKANNGQVVGKQ